MKIEWRSNENRLKSKRKIAQKLLIRIASAIFFLCASSLCFFAPPLCVPSIRFIGLYSSALYRSVSSVCTPVRCIGLFRRFALLCAHRDCRPIAPSYNCRQADPASPQEGARQREFSRVLPVSKRTFFWNAKYFNKKIYIFSKSCLTAYIKKKGCNRTWR